MNTQIKLEEYNLTSLNQSELEETNGGFLMEALAIAGFTLACCEFAYNIGKDMKKAGW